MKHVLLQLTRDWLRWRMKIRSKHACMILLGRMCPDKRTGPERPYVVDVVVPWHWIRVGSMVNMYTVTSLSVRTTPR